MITCVASGSQNIINGEMKRDQNIEIIISRLKVNNNEKATKIAYTRQLTEFNNLTVDSTHYSVFPASKIFGCFNRGQNED
jgi:hypothetical protein